MKNYSTDEIVKGCEICTGLNDCKGCPVRNDCHSYIDFSLLKVAAAKLEALQKGIDRLKEDNAELKEKNKKIDDQNTNLLKEISYLNDEIESNHSERVKELEQRIRGMAEQTQEKNEEIVNLQKRLAEIYTAEQFDTDATRYQSEGFLYDNTHFKKMSRKEIIEYIRNWAKYHPEPPKISNGDKFRKVFGCEPLSDTCFLYPEDCAHLDDKTDCEECEYGINAEYNQPSDK